MLNAVWCGLSNKADCAVDPVSSFVVTATMVGWPFLVKPTPTAQPLIIVDIVKLAPKTNLRNRRVRQRPVRNLNRKQQGVNPLPHPPRQPPPPAVEPVASATPESVPAAKQVAETAEILPEKSRCQAKTCCVRKPKAAAKPKTVNIKTPLSRPKRPERTEQKQVADSAERPIELARKSQQKQKADALNGVLQNLTQASLAKEDEKIQKATAKQDKTALAQSLSSAIGEAVKAPQTTLITPLGLSELDRLRAHISNCWEPPIGAKGADQLKVDIQVHLEKDGTVKQAEIADQSRYRTDVQYRAAANAARRAVLACQPLPLPPEKYQTWKEFIFGFDPKFM